MARPREFDVDQVLDRATELFWTKGYEETSMRDLEEGLGVGRQSLYSTFGDKRELFLAALDRYAALQRVRIEPLLAPDAGLPAIRAYFASVFSPSSCTEPRRSCMMLNSVVEFGQADPDVARRYVANQEHLVGAFRHALAGAVRKGELPSSIDQNALALFLVSQMYGLVVLSKGGAPPATLERVVATALSALGG
jgi:TetR/AcrR family transcriptional repressor of nem operon